MDFTLDELNFIANALRVAAEQYTRDANTFVGSHRNATYQRLAEQFNAQAAQARALSQRIIDQEG